MLAVTLLTFEVEGVTAEPEVGVDFEEEERTILELDSGEVAGPTLVIVEDAAAEVITARVDAVTVLRLSVTVEDDDGGTVLVVFERAVTELAISLLDSVVIILKVVGAEKVVLGMLDFRMLSVVAILATENDAEAA